MFLLVFGVLNVTNWLNDMRNHGCTGHELSWLLSVVIPVGCGAASGEAGWASTLVMSLPAWATSWVSSRVFTLSWTYELEEYGSAYVMYLILVYFGHALRITVLLPISKRLRHKAHAVPGETCAVGE